MSQSSYDVTVTLKDGTKIKLPHPNDLPAPIVEAAQNPYQARRQTQQNQHGSVPLQRIPTGKYSNMPPKQAIETFLEEIKKQEQNEYLQHSMVLFNNNLSNPGYISHRRKLPNQHKSSSQKAQEHETFFKCWGDPITSDFMFKYGHLAVPLKKLCAAQKTDKKPDPTDKLNSMKITGPM